MVLAGAEEITLELVKIKHPLKVWKHFLHNITAA